MKRILFLLILTTSLSVNAGFLDSWFLVYRVSGGSVNRSVGPFDTQINCMAARYSLPLNAEFIGCFQ